MTDIIDHEPDPKQAQRSRDAHLTALAELILEGLNNDLSCFRFLKDYNGFNDRVVLTDGARVLIRRLLKDNL